MDNLDDSSPQNLPFLSIQNSRFERNEKNAQALKTPEKDIVEDSDELLVASRQALEFGDSSPASGSFHHMQRPGRETLTFSPSKEEAQLQVQNSRFVENEALHKPTATDHETRVLIEKSQKLVLRDNVDFDGDEVDDKISCLGTPTQAEQMCQPHLGYQNSRDMESEALRNPPLEESEEQRRLSTKLLASSQSSGEI